MLRRAFACLLLAGLAALSQSRIPELPYQVDPDWPQLPPGWNFRETSAAAVDAQENVYVLNRGLHPIMVFDKSGKLLRSFGEGLFETAHGLRVDHEGNIWATDSSSHVVLKLDSNGQVRMVLGRWGQAAEAEDRFNRPTDVAVAPNGDIYVSDGYGNSRVVKLSKDGKFLQAWGKKGVQEGEFNLPHAIAMDRQGRVYVADRENFRIQIFDGNGKFLQQWNQVGSPWGLFITADQSLFMTDGYNNRVLKLNLDGQILGAIGEHGKLPGQFELCHHLAVGPSNSIYVAEITNWRVQKFAPR